MPHGVPSGKKVEAGEFITMDFGCVYEGYCLVGDLLGLHHPGKLLLILAGTQSGDEAIGVHLDEFHIDAMLCSSEPGEFYAVGLHGEGYAIVTAHAARYITDSRYIEVANETVTDAEVIMVDGQRYGQTPPHPCRHAVR